MMPLHRAAPQCQVEGQQYAVDHQERLLHLLHRSQGRSGDHQIYIYSDEQNVVAAAAPV
jgi:hypothetical protein